MSTANSTATEGSSQAPLIVIAQSHWDEAETTLKSWVQYKQDPDFLDFIEGQTLTEVLDRATDATSRFSGFTLALKVNHTAQKVSTAALSASIALNDSNAAGASTELLTKGSANRAEILNNADDQCLMPIASLMAFTDDSDGTCLSGELDESSKSRVHVARTAAKGFLALANAIREIATKDVDDAMSRVSTLMQSQ